MYILEIKSIDSAGTVEGWIHRGNFTLFISSMGRLSNVLIHEWGTLHRARILNNGKVIFKARFKLDKS